MGQTLNVDDDRSAVELRLLALAGGALRAGSLRGARVLASRRARGSASRPGGCERLLR